MPYLHSLIIFYKDTLVPHTVKCSEIVNLYFGDYPNIKESKPFCNKFHFEVWMPQFSVTSTPHSRCAFKQNDSQVWIVLRRRFFENWLYATKPRQSTDFLLLPFYVSLIKHICPSFHRFFAKFLFVTLSRPLFLHLDTIQQACTRNAE